MANLESNEVENQNTILAEWIEDGRGRTTQGTQSSAKTASKKNQKKNSQIFLSAYNESKDRQIGFQPIPTYFSCCSPFDYIASTLERTGQITKTKIVIMLSTVRYASNLRVVCSTQFREVFFYFLLFSYRLFDKKTIKHQEKKKPPGNCLYTGQYATTV